MIVKWIIDLCYKSIFILICVSVLVYLGTYSVFFNFACFALFSFSLSIVII